MADDKNYGSQVEEIQKEVRQLELTLSQTVSSFIARTGIPVVVYVSDPEYRQLGSREVYQNISVKALL